MKQMACAVHALCRIVGLCWGAFRCLQSLGFRPPKPQTRKNILWPTARFPLDLWEVPSMMRFLSPQFSNRYLTTATTAKTETSMSIHLLDWLFPCLKSATANGAPATAKESKHRVAGIAYLNGAIQQLQRFLRRETEILAFDSANGRNVRSPSLRAFCLV